MALLTEVFSRLLSMALMALPVMAVVLLVRLALSRAPRKYSYLLWLAVGFRLVCPISLDHLWSIFELPGLYTVAETTGAVGTGTVDVLPQVAAAMSPVNPAVTGGTGGGTPAPVGEAAQVSPILSEAGGISWSQLLLQIGAVLWLLGVIALLVVGIVSLVRLRHRLAEAVSVGDNVWESDAVPTPFVLGFLRPRIYLPPGLSGTERTCVLVHERHHIRRGDPWWKLLGWCILAVYWWNPAVWLCWVLFCRDMEMSCDEAVLAALGGQTKTGYSAALVSFALARRVPAALAFGEHDAARRVKHVLNWKRETPRIAFLAFAAVFLAVTVCVSNPALRPDSGHVWGVDGDARAWSLEYRFPEDTHAFVFYMEVYRYGELEDRSCLVLDGMAADGVGVTEREGVFPLELFREDDRTGLYFSNMRIPSVLSDRSASTQLTEWSYLRGKADLNLGGSAAVAVAWAPGEGTSSIDCGELNRQEPASVLRQCPVAVVLRLTVSRQGVDSLCQRIESGAIDLPAVLYGLRLDRALEGDLPTLPLQETLDQDLAGVRAILETLGVPDLENCTLELGIDPIGSGEGLGTLRVYCETPADREAFVGAMITASKLVPALVGDVDQVKTGYRNGSGRDWYTIYTKDGPNSLDEIAQELGWRDIHALGQTLEGVQALVDDIWAEDLPGLSTADTLAQRLWTAREASSMELEDLLLDEGIPYVDGRPAWVPVNHRSISLGEDLQTLNFRFGDPSATAQDVQQAMEKKAVVLLALRAELTEVTWTWTPEGGDGTTLSGALTAAEADDLLAAGGFSEGVKAMGASPAALAELLLWLESWAVPPTARELYDLAQVSTPETVAAEVVCRGPWSDAELEGTFTVSREGERVLLQFTREDAWERAVSMNRLASNGCLLLALYPELRGVRAFSPDRQSYLWVTDQTAGQSLPEGTAIGDYGASPEALDDLVALLAANAPAAIWAEPFQDILGYDGVRMTTLSTYGWSLRTYYAVAADGSHTAIAASFGWEEPEDYSVDLDGDGEMELVCNVAFGEDEIRRAYVYQRRPDGVYRGTPSPQGLEGFVDAGDSAYWSQYDPGENRIRLHYRVAGAQEYAVVTYEGMEGLTFEPFQG